MEVAVTTGAISRAKLQSNHHHQQTNSQFAQPTVSKHWREKYHIPWTCWPQTQLGVFQLCLWPLIAPGYLGGGLPCLSSALWCQYPNPYESSKLLPCSRKAPSYTCVCTSLLRNEGAGAGCWKSSLTRASAQTDTTKSSRNTTSLWCCKETVPDLPKWKRIGLDCQLHSTCMGQPD